MLSIKNMYKKFIRIRDLWTKRDHITSKSIPRYLSGRTDDKSN